MSEQSTSSNGDHTFDITELLEIRTRCRELRKERESLRDSQKQSLELIRKLEEHVQTLTCAHLEDRKRIQELERELDNCSQEIDYLQDQLALRNSELNVLGEEVCCLQLKLKDKEILEEETGRLREELENKELELQSSALLIEKFEESISSVGLEYQCEIESLKLDMTTLEQHIVELKKSQENVLFHDTELCARDAEGYIEHLERENAKLKEDLKLERMKGKEEAEDLAQEMAELRYHMAGLLEEERKRRASIEHLSLQRISKLEAQLEEERNKSFVNEEETGKAIIVSGYAPEE